MLKEAVDILTDICPSSHGSSYQTPRMVVVFWRGSKDLENQDLINILGSFVLPHAFILLFNDLLIFLIFLPLIIIYNLKLDNCKYFLIQAKVVCLLKMIVKEFSEVI